MDKIRIGVVGVGRGRGTMNFCKIANNCVLTAVCDKWTEGLETAKNEFGSSGVEFFSDYDEFLKADFDVVMLANYANEHAPFAIKAMEAGKDVISEVLPAQTLAEAVALIECVERTGRKYVYAENYCYMGAPREMRKKYLSGELGDFEYAEGEYVHNCDHFWPELTHGDPNHWRNNMNAFFYCTHSAGPIIHITGKRPARVVGIELPFNERQAGMGCKCGAGAIELVTFEDGTAFKSIHGGISKNSVWYTIYGSKGRMESAREDADKDSFNRVYLNLNRVPGVDRNPLRDNYIVTDEISEIAAKHGHGGSDYYCMYNAMKYFSGEDAEVIDVYEAIDMWLVGFFAYLSVLEGGKTVDIPDFRKKEVRDIYRYDNRCSDKKVAGDSYLPSYSKGDPDIPQEVYGEMYRQWREVCADKIAKGEVLTSYRPLNYGNDKKQ